MTRRSGPGALALWMNGQPVGTWRRGAGADADELHYEASWVQSAYGASSAPRSTSRPLAQGRPLSLSLPFRPGNLPHRGAHVRLWFENLLPDSPALRERMARRFGAASSSAFDLLAEVGRDCAGALAILPEGASPEDHRRIDAEPLDEAAVARLLRAARGQESGESTVAASSTPIAPISSADRTLDTDDLRLSIAGAQDKTALLWHAGRWWRPRGATPTTHILKLPLGLVGPQGLDLRDSVDNEWLCAQVAAAFGLPTARCHPLQFGSERVLAVERFDRRWVRAATAGAAAPRARPSQTREWLLRLPQEDFCQATATPPWRKYEADGGPGMATILNLLAGSQERSRDRAMFFRAQMLNWLLAAPDGHAKNYSIALHAGGRYTLAPLYDLISAWPLMGKGRGQIARQRLRLAMAVRSRNVHWRVAEILPAHWVGLAQRFGVVGEGGESPSHVVAEFAGRALGALAAVEQALPAGFPGQVWEAVREGVLSSARRLEG